MSQKDAGSNSITEVGAMADEVQADSDLPDGISNTKVNSRVKSRLPFYVSLALFILWMGYLGWLALKVITQ